VSCLRPQSIEMKIFVFKKPKSFQTPWAKWNSEGIDEVDEFIHEKGKYLTQTKSVDDLNYFRSRLTEAWEDFKNLFPKDLLPDEGMSRRNNENHDSYHNLQLDLGIPGPDERTSSVHFLIIMAKSWGALTTHSKSVQNFGNIHLTIGKSMVSLSIWGEMNHPWLHFYQPRETCGRWRKDHLALS
jgi:hypothetical protein